MLTRFAVKNYKCLADVDIPLTPIHVLIGENDTGKTSLLEAMYAFYRTSRFQVSEAFSGFWNATDLVYDGASEPRIDLESEFEPDGTSVRFEYGLSARFMGEDRQALSSDEWFERNEKRSLMYPQGGNFSHTALYNRRNLADPEIKQFADLGAAELDRADLYRLDARTMAIPAMISDVRKFRLDEDGFGLASLIDDMLSYDPQLFVDVRESFCKHFGQFKSVRLEAVPALDRKYRANGTFEVRHETGKGIFLDAIGGKSIRAQQASDGAILFLGLLTLMHLPKPPKLLLLEEPETGIYPKRLEQVITLLRDFINMTGERRPPQIVITTHSPYVLTFFQPEEVTFMSRQSDGSVGARPLRDAPNIHERMEGGFYLGELWYNLSETELFGDE